MTGPDSLLTALAARRILLANENQRLRFRAPEGALDTELREALRSHKESLLAALKDRPGFIQLCPPSYNQLSLFFLYLFDPKSPAYNLALAMRLRSPVDSAGMRAALAQLVQRHGQLRTTLGHVDFGNTPVLCQFVAERLPPVLEEFDAQGLSLADLRAQAHAFYAAPLNLETGPVVRAGLFTRAPADQVLVIKLHHIAADGWSLRLVARDLSRYYRDICLGQPAPEEPPKEAYTKFCLEQREFLSQPDGGRQMLYWQSTHTPPAAGLELGAGERRPLVRRSVGATQYFEIDGAEQARLDACAQTLGVTTFVLLLATFQAFLLRRSAQGEVVVGIPTLGRHGQRFEETVGYFVNPVALRSRRRERLSFRDHARRTAQEMTDALDHRDAPFAAIVERLGGARDPSRTPVFQALFNLLSRRMLGDVVDLLYPSTSETAIDFGGLSATSFALDQQEGQFDLTLEFVDRGAGLLGLFKYCTDLFSAEQASEMVGEIRGLLAQVTSDPDGLMLDGMPATTASLREPAQTKAEVVLAATFTAEAMQESFEYWFDRLGWQTEVTFAPFNQVFQTLLDPSSLLRQNRHGPGVILLRLDDLLGRSEGEATRTAQLAAGAIERLRANLDELAHAVEQAAGAADGPLCVVVCPSSPQLKAAVPDEKLLREDFAGRLQSLQGVHMLTLETLARWYPVEDYYEPLGEEIGNIPYTPAFLAALAAGVVRTLHAITNQPLKALVLDCDGTLWDGVVGEDGPDGVVIGDEQRQFHDFLLEQARAGVVLCLCSKNQEADVWSVLDRHPHTVLRREHFAFWRINWQAKSANIREIAAEINIGLDAIAFLDDSPLEREEVRANCPSVLCADLPEDWPARVPYLQHLWPLDRLRVTDEDRKRNEHYRSERLRADLQRSTGSLGDFLERLELEVDIHPAVPTEHERVAQLSVRTNQFNTMVRRMTAPEIAAYGAAPRQLVYATQVRDRFGDYGLVGAMLAAVQADSTLRVDSLLLSCRALGRGVEYRMVARLAEQAAACGCAWVEFPLRQTDRNEPARMFLRQLQDLCGGDANAEAAVRVLTERLLSVRYAPRESAAESEEAPPLARAPVPVDGSPVWDRRVLTIASELRTVDAILAALTERRHQKRLPRRIRPDRTNASPPPASDTERIISEAWQRALALDDVGTTDNFFELGGTSVLIAQVAVDLRRHGLAVSIVDLLHFPTIAALAHHLTQPEAEAQAPGPAATAGEQQRETLQPQQLPAPFARLRRHRGR